jgi:hypothetical protein
VRVAHVNGRAERMEGDERGEEAGRRRERLRRRAVRHCILLRSDLE